MIIQPLALQSKPASVSLGIDAFSDSLPSQAPGVFLFCFCERKITIREKPSSRTDRDFNKKEMRDETRKLWDLMNAAQFLHLVRKDVKKKMLRYEAEPRRSGCEKPTLCSEALLLEGHAGAESAAPGGDDGLHCQ